VTAVGSAASGTAVINADGTVTYTPNSGASAATDGFTYTVNDGHGGTSTASVVVYLADRPPVALDDSASTHAAPVTIPVLANDSDPDGDRLTVTAVGSASSGTAVINADGTVTYTPNSGATAATDGFTYTVSDGHGGTSVASVVVYLADRPPVANDDSASTHTAPVTIPVLANDSDPDGDRLTVTAVGAASSGTAVVNADNTVTYTPNSGATAATDGFTYTVSDGHGGTSVATVVIYLANRPPVALDDKAWTHTAAVTVAALANDSDPDGDRLTVTAVGAASSGIAVINADNTITYTPNSGASAATDGFTYTVSDGHGGTATATVVIYLGNRPPVAAGDSASTHSAAVVIPVLANDSDPDGDRLTVTAVGTASSGTAVINADGTVTYTPNAGASAATDSFTYTVSDGHGATSTATVTVQLTDRAPVAVADSASTHSAAVVIPVLVNDSDPDGDKLTVTAAGGASSGTAVVNADGTVTYTPNSGTTAATDTFTYTVNDGHGGTSTASVTVQLTDQAPVAQGDSVSTHSAPVTVAVLANDSDPDGDKLTVTAVGAATSGTAVINADNTVTYTPNSGTTAATDSFTYTVSDGHGGTSSATVTVQLADQAPVAQSDSASPHGSAVVVAVLANDSDPDGDKLTVTAAGGAGQGSVVINADNTVTYTPNAGTSASTDAFTYTVSDGHGGTSTGTVSVFLTDQAPVAVADSVSHATAAVTVAVLVNDYDPDGDKLTVTAVGSAGHGTTVLNADGTVTYTPNAGYSGATDNFTYTVSDGHGGTSTATVSVYLTNRAPVANNVTVTAHVGVPLSFNLLSYDSDPDGDALTLTNFIPAPHLGSMTTDMQGDITYTPNAGTAGQSETFTYTISDGFGGTSTATLEIDILA
jgi:serine/threonine protein phosphatase PrpC